MVNPSAHRPKRQVSRHPFQKLLKNSPVAFWSAIWVLMMVIAGAAVVSLLSPHAPTIVKSKPQPRQAIVRKSPTPPPGFTLVRKAPPKEEGMPLWLFGAIAVSCATGSLLILLPLNRPKTLKNKHPKSSPTAAKVPKKPPLPVQKPRPVTISPQIKSKSKSKSKSKLKAPVIKPPVVTVLPPEANYPTDGEDQNLAEMMDLRKRQSLSFLLKDKKN